MHPHDMSINLDHLLNPLLHFSVGVFQIWKGDHISILHLQVHVVV